MKTLEVPTKKEIREIAKEEVEKHKREINKPLELIWDRLQRLEDTQRFYNQKLKGGKQT